MRLAILLALVLDTSGRRSHPVLATETLGAAFTSLGAGNDAGLAISTWRNNTLERDERWHLTADNEWFVQARDGIYVLGVQDPEGWRTDPSVRIVRRAGAWTRVNLTR